MGGVPPQPHPTPGRYRDLVDDPPTDVFPSVAGPEPTHAVDVESRRARRAATDAGAGREPSHGHGSSHGHGHGHTAPPPAGRSVKVLLAALLVPAGIATLVGLVLLWPSGRVPAAQVATTTPMHAQVVETRAARCDDTSGAVAGD